MRPILPAQAEHNPVLIAGSLPGGKRGTRPLTAMPWSRYSSSQKLLARDLTRRTAHRPPGAQSDKTGPVQLRQESRQI